MYFLYANALIAFNFGEENLIVIFVYYDIWLFFFFINCNIWFSEKKSLIFFSSFFFSPFFFVVSL